MELTTEVISERALSLEKHVMSLKVTTTDELKNAGDLLFNIKEFIKNVDAKKKDLIKPFKVGIHGIEAEYDPKIEKAKQWKTILENEMVTFQLAEKAKAEAAERERREQELIRLERIKSEMEEQAAKTNDAGILNEAIKVEERQERMMTEPVKVRQSVVGDYATTGISMRADYEVVSDDDVPREYCSPDIGKLRRAVNDGVKEIKGVRIFEKASVTSRL